MLRQQAEREVSRMIASGYRHHAYEDEQKIHARIFNCERDELVDLLSSSGAHEILVGYADILAPTRLRGVKNSLICLITSISRTAIEAGLEVEYSFALSDFYINRMETVNSEDDLIQFAIEMLLHYYDATQRGKTKGLTLHVGKAIRFINRSLFSAFSVADVAAHVGLDAHYFSTLFTQQVGTTPSKYIVKQKLVESKKMLADFGASITETAEALQFSDAAHFSNSFKKEYGISPSAFKNGN